jgi:hypothetical protein
MADTTVPSIVLDEIRTGIINSSSYTDNEIKTYLRRGIQNVNQFVADDVTISDSTAIYEYTLSGDVISTNLWELYKTNAIYLILENKLNNMIADGVGISFAVGSEKIDTKSLLLTVKSKTTKAEHKLKENLLMYNMQNVAGSNVDLYTRDGIW